MKKQTKSLPRLSVPPPGALAFADGGKLDANQLMADIAAKYGVSGKSEAVPIQPPTPQPQPQPKAQIQHSGGLLQQASDGIRNRFKQADQAGYAQGGKISGPGTSKSDSIPAAVRQTGEQISVSNSERIVSAEQDKFLEGVAIAAGYENLDAMLKDGTGMPVGPTIKAGKRAAADGMAPDTDPDTDRRKTYSPSYGNAFVNRGASTGKPIQDGAIPQFPPALGAGFNGQSTAARGQSVTTPKQPSVTPSVPGVITAESAIGAAEAGMKRSGGVFGTIDMAGVNEILARENKVRAEMADAQRTDNKPGGGVLVIGDGAVTDQDRVNNERTQRWAIDDMASRIKSAGSRSERASLTQAMTTAMNNNVQQRGQDMNFAATISGQGITARGQDLSHSAALSGQDVTMRGQDIGAGNDGKRLSIEQSRLDNVNERWGIEKGIMQGQAADSEMVRTARSDLVSAINSGDQAKIEAAKAKAVAAGIKFDKPNNEFTAVTDNMGMNITRTNKDTGAVDIIDGKTGKLKASIPSPGQRPAAVPIEAFAAQIRAKNPGQSITDEQIAAAYKNQFGVK